MKDYGSIYLRKDGYYYGRVQYKKEKRGFYSKSRNKVQKSMNYWVSERKYSTAAFAGDVLLSEYCYCYLFVYKYGSIKNSSFDRLIGYVKKHIDNSVVDVPVEELDVVVLQNYLEHIKLSDSSKVKILGFVRAVLRYAYSRNDIDYDAGDYLVFSGSESAVVSTNNDNMISIVCSVLNIAIIMRFIMLRALFFYKYSNILWCRGSPSGIRDLLLIKGG